MAVENAGNRNQLAIKVGVPQHYIKRWLDGDVKSMDDELWDKVYPFIRPYLPQSDGGFNSSGSPIITYPDFEKQFSNTSELRPIPPSQLTSIPIIGVAQALNFDRTLQSFDEFIADNSTGRAPAIGNMGDGMAAIAVDGTSMTPFYPDGTIVYFSIRQTPKNGDRVIAKLKKEQALVFKLFCKTNGHVELKSIDKDGRNFTFSNPADNPFEWIYPVKYSLRDEDALDRELDNHNIERLPTK